MDATTIESRTIDGRVYLAADDVVTALRTRAGDYAHQAEQLGDPVHPDYEDVALAYHATAHELRTRADLIDCAVIAHISE